MQRDEVIAVLRRAATSGDDWFSLDEAGDGTFQVSDGTGATAIVAVDDQWAEVRAGRAASAVGQPIAPVAPASLLRAVVQPGDPPVLLLRGRVYLDGFSLHALYCTVRDVLQLAGPLPAAAPDVAVADEREPAAAVDEWIEEQGEQPGELWVEQPAAEDEAVTEVAVAADEPSESAVAEADGAYVPATGAGEASDESEVEQATVDERIAVAAEEAIDLPPEEGQVVPEEETEFTPEPVVTPTLEAPLAAREAATADAPLPPAPVAGVPLTSSVGATVQMSRAAMQEALAAEPSPAPPAAAGQVCRRCGARVEEGERFCISCGAPQPGADEPPPAAAEVPPLRRSTEPETVAWRRPSLDAPEATAPAQPAVARCGRCGYENPSGNRFCQGCGSALAAV